MHLLRLVQRTAGDSLPVQGIIWGVNISTHPLQRHFLERKSPYFSTKVIEEEEDILAVVHP